MTGTPVGLTKDVGWNVGVSKTLPLDVEAAWRLLLSPAGLSAWLGDELAALPTGLKERYETANGTTGEIRGFRPGDRVRVTWHPPGREAPATLQATVRAGARGTAVRFHAEHLASAEERAAFKARWAPALARLASA